MPEASVRRMLLFLFILPAVGTAMFMGTFPCFYFIPDHETEVTDGRTCRCGCRATALEKLSVNEIATQTV